MSDTQPKVKSVSVNPARSILQREVIHRFAETSMIESLSFADAHYTSALIAPLAGAPGLWIVFKWIDETIRPFSFSSDAGCLEIISPEECARLPLDLTHPKRIVHLYATANMCPMDCSECPRGDIMQGPMEPVVRCRMPNNIQSGRGSDHIVLSVMSYIMARGEEECARARTIACARVPSTAPQPAHA
ncbi:MAG: hypothetical protein KBC33_02090 [Candidatus Pacebacteria bacterium]|nr:hypothetical protein [Candidatus Paceibacterota bacterium]